jgi:hypothetical protein
MTPQQLDQNSTTTVVTSTGAHVYHPKSCASVVACEIVQISGQFRWNMVYGFCIEDRGHILKLAPLLGEI